MFLETDSSDGESPPNDEDPEAESELVVLLAFGFISFNLLFLVGPPPLPCLVLFLPCLPLLVDDDLAALVSTCCCPARFGWCLPWTMDRMIWSIPSCPPNY
jgi:hypothetical protein